MSKSLTVARNITTTFISQVISWALTFVVILYLPHYAGVNGFGKLTLAGSFAGVFGLVAALGTGTVMIREIPRNPPSAGRLILAALTIKIPLTVLALVLGEFFSVCFGYSREVQLFICINLSLTVVGVVSDVVGSAFGGLEDFAPGNVAGVIGKFIGSAGTVLVCIMRWPLWVIVALPGVSVGFTTWYMLRCLSKRHLVWQVPTLAEVTSLAKAALPFFWTSVFVTIYGKTDAIILSKMTTVNEIGWYSLGNRIAGTAMSLPTAVCAAMMPTLSGFYTTNKGNFVEASRRLINLMIICCMPLAVIMIFCPRPLVILFSHNTSAFLPAQDVVRVCGVSIMLWFVAQALWTIIVTSDNQKVIYSSMGVAALFNVPVTAVCSYFTLHFFHNAATGAAFSDTLTEIYLVTCYCRVLPPGIVFTGTLKLVMRSMIAAIPIALLLTFLPLKYGLWSLLPGTALYGVLCFIFKCLHQDDVDLVRKLIRGKFGLAAG